MLFARKSGTGGKKRTKKGRGGRKFEFVCKNCQKELILTRRDLERANEILQELDVVGTVLNKSVDTDSSRYYYY